MANALLAKEHLNEAVVLLSLTTVVAIFYTLILVLYYLSFQLSYAQLRDDCGKIKRKTVCTLILQTVLLICATLNVIISNRHVQIVFIDKSTLPGGPLGLPAALNIATLARLGNVVNIVENLLILAMLLWRVRVIWAETRFVLPVTILSSFFYLGNAGFGVSFYAIRWNFDNTSLVATPRAQEIIFLMAEIFSFASLVFMTLAIIARLLFIRRKHIKLMGKSDVAGQYLGIATMLIESYALDALWSVGTLISYGLKYAPTANFFLSCSVQVDILTSFLVVYRVLSGRAWERQTQGQLSALRWASNGAGTATSGTGDLYRMSTPRREPPVISLRNGV